MLFFLVLVTISEVDTIVLGSYKGAIATSESILLPRLTDFSKDSISSLRLEILVVLLFLRNVFLYSIREHLQLSIS
jgi:hypothetical protein